MTLYGVGLQKDAAVAEISRVEPAKPVKPKTAYERSDYKSAGSEDRTAMRKEIRFDRMSSEEKERLQEELDKHNEKFAYTGKFLKFKFDEEAAMMYVEVIDTATQEVIVSLPPEFLIDLSIKMRKILGLYIDEKL